MLRPIVVLHRWMGIAFGLVFAMWFATGAMMHFVPFPSLSEAERFAGLSPLQGARLISPAEAIKASGIGDAVRLRLLQRADGPVYIVIGRHAVKAVNAETGADAHIQTIDVARAEASRFARDRNIAGTSVAAELEDYDQWTVPNGFDRYRPLFRFAWSDPDATDIYVASNTGEIVLITTHHQRVWNYAGSVLHWIYPTVLRRDWALWDRIVWNGSLLAAIAALLGAILGIARLRIGNGRIGVPYRGWHAWHHVLGLATMTFVLTWIISGWLSMDHGRLFSRGQLSESEIAIATPILNPDDLASDPTPLSSGVRDVEWFAFGDRTYRRDRNTIDHQTLARVGHASIATAAGYLTPEDITAMTSRLALSCEAPQSLPADDAYTQPSNTPIYRVVCGEVWFDIDAGNGEVVARWDSSRRAYRWVYSALHTFDFPVLLRYPLLRTLLVGGLCTLGFAFSITGVVIGWRRLRLSA